MILLRKLFLLFLALNTTMAFLFVGHVLATKPEEDPCRDVLYILDQYPSDINAVDAEGNTRLHWAAKCGLFARAKEYLGLQADIYARNNFFEFPLHEATGGGHDEITEMLIGHAKKDLESIDIMVNAKNKIGETPSHEAAERCQLSTLRILRKYHADFRLKNDDDETPYEEALEEDCSQQVVNFLATISRIGYAR